jgi:hypothetical protein
MIAGQPPAGAARPAALTCIFGHETSTPLVIAAPAGAGDDAHTTAFSM